MSVKHPGRILLTDFPSPEWEDALKALDAELTMAHCTKEDELIPLVREVDYVVNQAVPVTAKVIDAMAHCRLIIRCGIGVDGVDLKAAAARGIPVCNVPDYCVDEVADHAFAMILDLTRRITFTSGVVKSGIWSTAGLISKVHALKDMVVGVVAFGRIGREVAARLKAFKPQILVFDPAVPAEVIRAAGFAPVTFDQLLEQSDVISLHCPSNEKTRHMINAWSIARMKPGVVLVNTARGTLVNNEDLFAALRAGTISAAALDVFDPEPIPKDSPVLGMENVILTPHLGASSPQALQRLFSGVVATVATAIRGERLPNVVNGVVR
jgi:D-3-phosphoglycerate dehydrogenase